MPPTDKHRAPARVTRSISFEGQLMAHLKKRAREWDRSVNWVVNELVRRESKSKSCGS